MKKSLLELELTNLCNARCIMCPAGDMKRKKGFMTRETFEAIIKKGIDYGIQTIRFCGLGEPLLHEDFCHFISHVRKYDHLNIELITNGSLLLKEKVRLLAQHNLDFLSISFPSLVAENYESIMKGLSFENALEKVLYAIQELKKASATHIKITGVMTGVNYDERADIKKFWSQKGVDCIELHTPHNRGGHLEELAALDPSFRFDHASEPGPRKSLCAWPLRQFFVAWDGSVFLCCCDMEGEYRIGNVWTDEFSQMEKIQESICLKQPDLCKRCSYQKARIIQ